MVAETREEDAVVAALLELARRRAEDKVEEARARAQEIIEEAKKEAERILAARREKALREMEEEISRRKSAAEVEARKLIMDVKARYVGEAIEKAREMLHDIVAGRDSRFNYAEVLERLAEEAVKGLGSDEVYLMGREADRQLLEQIAERLSSKLGVKVRVDDNPIRTVGGVVARDAQDRKRFYNTLEGRLRDVQETKIHEISDILFGR